MSVRTSGSKAWRRGSIVAAFALWMTGAPMEQSAAAQGQPATGIGGAVVERGSGRAISDAAITVEGSNIQAITNVLGRFQIDNVSAGTVALVVRAPGYLELRVSDVRVPAQLTIELDPTPNFMEQVQVTATKTSVSIGDVAAPTTIVESTAIDLRGDQSLTQAITNVPGAYVSTELGLFDSVLLRGLPRQGNEFTNTLLLVDGVPQTTSGNQARVVALPINDANRIEVVRGPNSALYGRTAIGGVVNLLTAWPTPEHEAGIEFTTGQFETVKGVFDASGPVQQWGGYYASVAAERNGGFWENKVEPHFAVGNSALFAKLMFQPDARSFGSVSANRVISNNSTPTNEPIMNGQLLHEIDPRFDRFTNLNLRGAHYNQEEGRLTFNYSRDLGSWLRVVELFGYRNVKMNFIEDGDFIGTPYDFEANTITMYPFSQDIDEDIYYQEARLESIPRGSMRHSFLFGVSYEKNNGSLDQDLIDNDPDLGGFTLNYIDPVIPPKEDWNHFLSSRVYNLGITGIFGQYLVEPTRRLLLNVGGRYDRLDMDATRTPGSRAEDSFDAFSPKLSATFKLAGVDETGTEPTVNLYGAYSQAFLPPRAPSSLTPANVEIDLVPEDIENYEGGLKAGLMNGQLSFEASYFQMTEDGVVLSKRQGPFFIPTNAGQRKYKGFETGAGWAASTALSLYFNGGFYHHRYSDFTIESDDGDTVLDGNRLEMSPDHIISWGAVVRPVPSVSATFDVKHVGGVMVNPENEFELDKYTLVDASVSYQVRAFRITLSAHNLFNEEYYWNGGSEADTADPGRPRQVLVTTALRFK